MAVCSSIYQVLLKSVPWFCRSGWSKIAHPHYFVHWLYYRTSRDVKTTNVQYKQYGTVHFRPVVVVGSVVVVDDNVVVFTVFEVSEYAANNNKYDQLK